MKPHNVMSRATESAPEVGRCSISWPSNPPESGLPPHLRCFPALLNVSLYSGRHGAGLAVDSGAPGRMAKQPGQACPTNAPAALQTAETWQRAAQDRLPPHHLKTAAAHSGRLVINVLVSCPRQTATRTGLFTPSGPEALPLSYSMARLACRTATVRFLIVRG